MNLSVRGTDYFDDLTGRGLNYWHCVYKTNNKKNLNNKNKKKI